MKDDSTISIVTSVDHNYLTPLRALLKSISQFSTLDNNIEVYVLYSCLSTKERIEIETAERLRITSILVDDKEMQGFKISGHISIATYYRLTIAHVLPHLNKVIYLDSDTILNANPDALWNWPLEGRVAGAVRQAWIASSTAGAPRGLPSHALLGIPSDTPVFNAGVMVIDLEKWRQKYVSKRIFEYLTRFEAHVLWWDQDGLNAVLHDEWTPIDLTWNVMASHVERIKCQADCAYPWEHYLKVISSPSLVHFSSEKKPWDALYNGPYREYFERYHISDEEG